MLGGGEGGHGARSTLTAVGADKDGKGRTSKSSEYLRLSVGRSVMATAGEGRARETQGKALSAGWRSTWWAERIDFCPHSVTTVSPVTRWLSIGLMCGSSVVRQASLNPSTQAAAWREVR